MSNGDGTAEPAVVWHTLCATHTALSCVHLVSFTPPPPTHTHTHTRTHTHVHKDSSSMGMSSRLEEKERERGRGDRGSNQCLEGQSDGKRDGSELRKNEVRLCYTFHFAVVGYYGTEKDAEIVS
jgi:hypothetical protein